MGDFLWHRTMGGRGDGVWEKPGVSYSQRPGANNTTPSPCTASLGGCWNTLGPHKHFKLDHRLERRRGAESPGGVKGGVKAQVCPGQHEGLRDSRMGPMVHSRGTASLKFRHNRPDPCGCAPHLPTFHKTCRKTDAPVDAPQRRARSPPVALYNTTSSPLNERGVLTDSDPMFVLQSANAHCRHQRYTLRNTVHSKGCPDRIASVVIVNATLRWRGMQADWPVGVSINTICPGSWRFQGRKGMCNGMDHPVYLEGTWSPRRPPTHERDGRGWLGLGQVLEGGEGGEKGWGGGWKGVHWH